MENKMYIIELMNKYPEEFAAIVKPEFQKVDDAFQQFVETAEKIEETAGKKDDTVKQVSDMTDEEFNRFVNLAVMDTKIELNKADLNLKNFILNHDDITRYEIGLAHLYLKERDISEDVWIKLGLVSDTVSLLNEIMCDCEGGDDIDRSMYVKVHSTLEMIELQLKEILLYMNV